MNRFKNLSMLISKILLIFFYLSSFKKLNSYFRNAPHQFPSPPQPLEQRILKRLNCISPLNVPAVEEDWETGQKHF